MLEVKGVSFSYLEDEESTVRDVNFSLKEGGHMTLLGASGCGKTTLLKIIYGLFAVNKGQVFWKGQELKGPEDRLIPGEPFMKYVSQDFDLFPFHSVTDNVAKHLPPNLTYEDKEERIYELLQMVEMLDYADVKGKFLSGGQKQRVALIRALANEPEVLLLDEPFSHIDHFRKNDLRRELFSYLKKKGITCIVATHDKTEALSFSDYAVVMKDGEVVDKGTPIEIYQSPKNKYVANLFGEVNQIPLKDLRAGEAGTVLIYPHEFFITNEKAGIEVVVDQPYFQGGNYLIKSQYNNDSLFFESSSYIEPNTKVLLDVPDEVIENRKKRV